MKAKTYTLKTVFDVNQLLTLLKTEWRKASTSKKPLIVIVSDNQEDYTSAQRRLYFKWCTQFAKHQGDDDKSIHTYFKKTFLIDIYRRDDAGFAAMCDAIAALRKTEPEQHRAIGEGVIKLTSITNASKAQMTEYLDKIYHFCVKQNCYLQCPDDLNYLREMNGE